MLLRYSMANAVAEEARPDVDVDQSMMDAPMS